MWMSDEDLRQEDIRNARFSQQKQKDLIREYAELRQLLKNPYASMKVHVLEPVCEYCRYGRVPMEEGDSFVSLSHPIRPPRDNCYLYPSDVDRGVYAPEHGIVMRDADDYEISCDTCQEDLTGETMLFVRERSFQDYFCLTDQSNGLPKWLRRHILDCYGRACFACGAALSPAALTIDHIVPQSKGGDSRPTNIQPVCEACNQKKRDADPQPVYVFLDFRTRPAPSDAYGEMIW